MNLFFFKQIVFYLQTIVILLMIIITLLIYNTKFNHQDDYDIYWEKQIILFILYIYSFNYGINLFIKYNLLTYIRLLNLIILIITSILQYILCLFTEMMNYPYFYIFIEYTIFIFIIIDFIFNIILIIERCRRTLTCGNKDKEDEGTELEENDSDSFLFDI